jgi:hypothetical protein
VNPLNECAKVKGNAHKQTSCNAPACDGSKQHDYGSVVEGAEKSDREDNRPSSTSETAFNKSVLQDTVTGRFEPPRTSPLSTVVTEPHLSYESSLNIQNQDSPSSIPIEIDLYEYIDFTKAAEELDCDLVADMHMDIYC